MKITDQQLKRLRDFIQEDTGVFIDDKKLISTYKRKVEEIIKANKYDSFEKFFIDVSKKRNPYLYHDVINAFTINETYFFRESHQFDTLVKHIIPELHKLRPRSETINILSAPCSTGEELYSIAIYMMEYCPQYLEERDFLLLGIDIDTAAIEKAKEGKFSKRSIHRLPPYIRMKYFREEGGYFVAKPVLKEAVNFDVGNVMDAKKMKKLGRFDVIFSRNMLIYFNERDQIKVLEIFYDMLKPKGYLFLGHAEKVPSHMKMFKPMKIGESFLYRRT